MGVVKNIIDNYIDAICTEVKEDEEPGYVDLMMDNHKCIEWGEKEYYIPENYIAANEDEEFVYEYLTNVKRI
jgi:F420-dependent methylenetetrahydromethanopterin dehydrogenase